MNKITNRGLLVACTHVKCNGDNEDKTFYDVLIRNINHHEVHAVGESHDNKCTDNSVCNLANAAADSCAADVRGSDSVKLEAVASCRSGG